ncbi:Lrp/AsnC family transcriptional regulator [Candidatus Woesearchaeota archaeon]|nr:MAG: Lrp/AsnC family transcriptional regulator [Candidatus Woesearchaeota archaeon]
MLNLDLKDRKILYQLDLNSRQSFHAIAKKVGLSKDAVIYRINKLQEEGIINSFHTIFDAGKLGYISFRLYIKLQNTTPQKEKEIIEFLKQQKSIIWIASIEGNYDIGICVLAKTTENMNALWQKLMLQYTGNIEKKLLVIFTKVLYYPRQYILETKQNFHEFLIASQAQPADIDDTDVALLKLLAENARVSILELAKQLHITPKTVTARIKALERKKVIVGYRTFFNIEKLGYQYFKVHINLQNVTQEKYKQLKSYIKQHPNIIYDNEVLGGDDIELDVQVKDMKDLRIFLDALKERFADSIKNYQYMVFYQEHKYVFFPV